MRIAKGNTTPFEKTLMSRNDVWHKIEVYRGASLDKELVLKSILLAVQPIDLIPVRYTISGEDSYFLIRNCENALQALCRLNLIIKTVTGDMLLLTITLGFASIHDLKVNIRPLLLALLTKRKKHNFQMLNLDSFHRDPEIANTVYCPLFLPRTLTSVLNIAVKDLSKFQELSLRNNELSCLTGLEPVKLEVTSLDLRNNDLLNADCLSVLQGLNITELWLDGNPLCDNYASPSRYVESIRRYCPNLIQLDGVNLGSPGFPISQDNYLPANREELVYQFVKHYFTLYDGPDRGCLKGIYHPKALFSLSLDTTFAARLSKPWVNQSGGNLISAVLENPVADSEKILPKGYAQENRNMIMKDGFEDKIFCGAEIANVLKSLPETQHLPESFKICLTFNEGKYVAFTVDGIFRRYNEVFIFNRTFVLTSLDEEEFKILNDQLLVYCTGIRELKLDEEMCKKVYEKKAPLRVISSSEKVKLVRQLKKITRLKEQYCQMVLDRFNWDLREAIISFIGQYTTSSIPDEAFV